MHSKNNRVKGCWSRGMAYNKPNKFNILLGKKTTNIPYSIISNSKINYKQKNLFNFFKYNFPKSKGYEDFTYNKNTPYATIILKQSHFNNGTVRITKPGRYILAENITFNPNESNDFSPTQIQISSGLYPEMMNGPYHLGFFAAITVECENVIIDLNNKILKQSEKHAFQQRFYANIELANSPFITKQGPGNFNGSMGFKSSNNVLIMNGTLGNTSHHGIHANSAKNIILYNLDITNFEVAGIALNGTTDSILSNINIHDNKQNIKILSTYSQARFIRKHLNNIPDESLITLNNNNISAKKIKDDLNAELDNTFTAFKNNSPLPENIFKNPEPEKGYDGNVYGIVLNVNGVVINDFFKERTENMQGNENIFLNDIKINNISSNPIELVGLSDTSGNCAVNEAYGKNLQSGPIGDIIQIENITSQPNILDGTYVPNVLSNAQLLVAKYSSKPKLTKCFLEWAANNTNLKEKLIIDEKYYFVSGRDSMAHTMKGNIGLFISAGINIYGSNVSITNIKNIATIKNLTNFSPMCPNIQSIQPYVAKQNITVASKNININNGIIPESKMIHHPINTFIN